MVAANGMKISAVASSAPETAAVVKTSFGASQKYLTHNTWPSSLLICTLAGRWKEHVTRCKMTRKIGVQKKKYHKKEKKLKGGRETVEDETATNSFLVKFSPNLYRGGHIRVPDLKLVGVKASAAQKMRNQWIIVSFPLCSFPQHLDFYY